MRLRYEISHWHSETATRAAHYETCSRKDRAATVLWSQIYAMLEGNGLLDRPVAHRLMHQFDACEIAPPRHGYYRREVFKLSSGEHVIFCAERI